MAKKINLTFHGKTYIIEYANRTEVLEYFKDLKALSEKVVKDNKDETVDISNLDIENGVDAFKILLKAGLIEHHKDDMPSDKEIEEWILSIPNSQKFFEHLVSMVQDVLNTIEDNSKNISWEVVEV